VLLSESPSGEDDTCNRITATEEPQPKKEMREITAR
jgi:hypothetical protein